MVSQALCCVPASAASDRKSTRLNSSHLVISYAVFCLKKTRSCGKVRRADLALFPPVCHLPRTACLRREACARSRLCYFFNDTATTEIYTLSLHDALPI